MAKLIDGTRIYGSANIDNNLIVNTMNIVPTIVAAFDKANQQTNLAFTTIVANGTSLIADSNADTLTIRTTGNVSITADASGDNMTFDLTTTGVTAATYGGATIVPVFVVDSRGRLTSVTNTTIDTTVAVAAFTKANQQTNLAFSTIVANGTSLVADSNADTLTILTSGNVSITADAAGDNMTFDLTTTGVTAATYGGATIVPVLTVDAKGRLTSVTNTTINTFSFGVVAANGTSLVADTGNDTLTIRTTGNVSITADAAGDNMTFDLTTTGVTATTYGSSTIVPVFAVDSRGRLTSVTNTTIDTTVAVAAFAKANQQTNLSFKTVVANGTSLVADTNAATLTIRTTGNVAITADAAGDNMTFDLTTTGVTAATYGNSTIVPVFAVDSRGRLTSVTNTTIDMSTKFNANGGTISGDVRISGNLTISGNTILINVQNYQVDDSLIYLAANNYTSDLVDIGFIANYVNATGSNVHTGLMRDAVTKEYYLFQGYDKEPTNNHIDPNGNNFTISVLNANLKSSNIVLNGTVVNSWITSSYDKANSANVIASASFDKANSANVIASAAFDKANSANVIASASFDKANSANVIASAAFDKANGANVIASAAFDNANSANVIASAAFDRANSANVIASASFDKANSANVIASAAFDRANIANTLPVQKSGNLIGTRNALNFIEGSNVTITIADDSVGNRINVTIASSGGGGGGGGSGTNSVVFISDTAPVGTANGTLWWSSSDGTLYINYGDSDSNQWVVTNPFISAVANANASSSAVTTGKAIAMAIVFGG